MFVAVSHPAKISRSSLTVYFSIFLTPHLCNIYYVCILFIAYGMQLRTRDYRAELLDRVPHTPVPVRSSANAHYPACFPPPPRSYSCICVRISQDLVVIILYHSYLSYNIYYVCKLYISIYW